MLASSKHFKSYCDMAWQHGGKYLSSLSTLNCSPNGTDASSSLLKKSENVLCSNANTRQRSFVEIANGANILHKRTITTTSSGLSNMFNVQDDKDFKERVVDSKKPVIVDFYAT